MKLDLQAKFLQHLSQKKQDEGFTLIELLVVIIIIGILSAIALPSFLNQANKAKQSEAKTYVGSANRAQQAYYSEKGEFVSDKEKFGLLGLGVATQTVNYKYLIAAADDGVVTRAIPLKKKDSDPKPAVKAYIGGVKVGTIGEGESKEATTLAVLCEALKPPVSDGDSGDTTVPDKMKATDIGPPECPSATYQRLDK